MAFNWLYTSWNDNEYILFLIIVILFFIIVDFKLLKRKTPFIDITTIPVITPSTTSNATIMATTIPATTLYQAPTATNPANKDRKSTRLNSSHSQQSRMPSSA